MEIILNIKEIRNSEIHTDRIITARETGDIRRIITDSKSGDFSRWFINNNQIFDISVLKNKSVLEMTTKELSEMGEFISKAQELIALMSGKDKDYALLKQIAEIPDKPFARPIRAALNSGDSGRIKSMENKIIEAYAFLLGLNVHTAHQVLTNYRKKCSTVFNRIKLFNFTTIVFSGMTPDEIQILFGLSDSEKTKLITLLYTELADVIKTNQSFSEWRNVFAEKSSEILEILNERIAGNMNRSTPHPSQDYMMDTVAFDLYDTDTAMTWAEMSVKILFFTEIYKKLSVSYIRDMMQRVLESEPGPAEEAFVEEMFLSEDEFREEIRDNLQKNNMAFFSQIQDRLLSSICQINEKTSRFIKDYFIGGKEYVKGFTLDEIAYICLFMRTDVETECIRHIFGLDTETTRYFIRLFKNRI